MPAADRTPLPPGTPAFFMLTAMAIAGFIRGAFWGFIPGVLKAKLNVNEIITSLMLNYIALSWNRFFIFGVWSEGGFEMSKVFPKTAWLPRLADYAREYPVFAGITLHLGVVFGLVAAAAGAVNRRVRRGCRCASVAAPSTASAAASAASTRVDRPKPSAGSSTIPTTADPAAAPNELTTPIRPIPRPP